MSETKSIGAIDLKSNKASYGISVRFSWNFSNKWNGNGCRYYHIPRKCFYAVENVPKVAIVIPNIILRFFEGLLFCAIFFLLSSCANSIKLKKSKSYRISVPAKSSTITKFQDQEVVLWFDQINSTIHINSVFDNSIDSVMKVPKLKSGSYDCRMAPSQGLWVTKLQVSDEGSILLFEYNSNRLIEIGSDSIFTYEYNLPDQDISRSGGFESNIIQHRDTLVLNLSSESFKFTPLEPRVVCITKWRSSNPEYLLLHPFPAVGSSEYPVEGWYPINYTALVDGRIYNSFDFSDSISVSKFDDTDYERINAAAEIPLDNKLMENPDDYFSHQALERFKDMEKYHRIIYDPHNNLFYRIVARKTTFNTDVDNVAVNHKPFQILVFDQYFNKLQEFNFSDQYLFKSVYPTSKGLIIGYISSPEDGATIDKFVLFKVKVPRKMR